MYLTNLLHGLPLVQNVAIVSERGEVKGYLKVAVQELQPTSPSKDGDVTNEQIKLMRNYRNATAISKISFDDGFYFESFRNQLKSPSNGDLTKSSDSFDPNSRFVEGESQPGLADLSQTKCSTENFDGNKVQQGKEKEFLSPAEDSEFFVPTNENLQKIGSEYRFRVTVLEASQISSDYADIFCQFNFLHQKQEAYSTEPLKNQGKPGPPLGFFHVQNVRSETFLIGLFDVFVSLFSVRCHDHSIFYRLSSNEAHRFRSHGSLPRTVKLRIKQVCTTIKLTKQILIFFS